MGETAYDVIMVGAGFGGSACAGMLARRGLKVLLVEKNARAGGKAMSLSKNGFTYTAWVVIGAPVIGNLHEAAAKELGVEDLIELVAPGTQGSMYRTSSGQYARLPSMPVGQTDPNVVFDWIEVRQEEREGVVYFEVPSNYDPTAAPAGKQIMLTGSFCSPSPQMSAEEIAAWAKAGEEIVFKAFPELEGAIEDKELYSPRDVSNLTRESVPPGHGGETIGLGRVVGQCGPDKPSIQAPIRGLFFLGCDAGGTGVGTQQAIESGMNVAEAVLRHHQASKHAA